LSVKYFIILPKGNGADIREEFKRFSPTDAVKESTTRQNLIIVAHGRSGSSFTGNIFNYHPSVFYLFEPYQTVERLHGGVAPFNRDYQEKSFELMQGVFRCKFVPQTRQ